MRHTLTVAVIAGCALLALGLIRSAPSSAAPAASAPVRAALSTAVTQSGEVHVFLYDDESKRLTWYQPVRQGGLDIRGIRDVEWDLRMLEYPQRRKNDRTSVAAVRKLALTGQKANGADEEQEKPEDGE